MESFHVKTDVLVERDLAAGILNLLDRETCTKVAVFTNKHVGKTPAFKKMLEGIEGSGRATMTYIVSSGEPTTDDVNAATEVFRGKGIDMFIAIGGGSVMDLCKSVSALVVNEGVVEDYQGTGKKFMHGVKKICVPTTAGTGCEISGAAVLINEKTAFKRGVVGPGVIPDYALLCAELGVSVPVPMTVGCGFDAMAHAIESYVSSKANRWSRIFSKEAFLKLYYTLPKVCENPDDITLREDMLYGSCLAGYAIDNASTGAAHGMSYGPGIHFHIPHGFAVGIFFPDTMEINIEKGCYDYADLYRLLDEAVPSGDDKQDAEAFVRTLREYGPYVQYMKSLEDYGVTQADYELLCKASMQNTVAYATNPVPFTDDDCRRIYKKLLKIQ